MRTFTMHEASARTGATPRQIDHLVGKGVVVPTEDAPRRGMTRRFSLENLVEIAIAVCTRHYRRSIVSHGARLRFREIRDPRGGDRQVRAGVHARRGCSDRRDGLRDRAPAGLRSPR